MALDFQFPAAQPLKGGLQQPVPITLNTPLQSAPQTAEVDIDWTEYGASSTNPVAVEIDLSSQGSPGPTLDQIRSVYIDNSFSFVPIYVKFPGTNMIVICPANSIGMFPVIAGIGLKKAIVYAQGFDDTNIPVTTFQFMNIEVAGWVAGTGEFSPPIPQVSISRTSQQQAAAANTTAYSFNNTPIGTADNKRTVYVHVQQRANSGNADISSVTIGGNPATLIKKIANGNICEAIYGLNVAAGASVNVTVNTTTTFQTVEIYAYAAYNLTTPLAAFAFQTVTTPTNPSAVLVTSSNGCAIAGAIVFTGSGFSGIGNNQTFPFAGFVAGEGYQVTSGANLPISMTGNPSGSAATTLLAVSFK